MKRIVLIAGSVFAVHGAFAADAAPKAAATATATPTTAAAPTARAEATSSDAAKTEAARAELAELRAQVRELTRKMAVLTMRGVHEIIDAGKLQLSSQLRR